jgi:glycosyltransferase involved in cell wall biosynthesis
MHLTYILLYCFFKRLKILLSARKYDLVVIEKEIIPYFPPIIEKVLVFFHVKFILDFDDAIFHNYDQSRHWIIRKLLAKKIPKIVSLCNGVVSGNGYLSNYAKTYNANTIEIPTSIDLEKYADIETIADLDNERFIIGWIGGKSTSHYVENLLPILAAFAESNQNIEIRLIGFYSYTNCTCLSPHIKIVKWSAETEIKELRNIDVGIMPLDYTLWDEGKCGFKLIQYMACSKPTISTPMQTNIAIDGGIGNLFAQSDEEWYNALHTVLNNRQKYRRIGSENRNRVKENYSIQTNCNYFVNFIKKIQVCP